MNRATPARALRVVALATILGAALWIADRFFGQIHPKTQGWLLGAVAAVIFLGEAFFWKPIDKLAELPHSDALSAVQAKLLLDRVQALKRRLMQRWYILLVLKAIAGVCAAWLLSQTNPGGNQKVIWLIGVGALVVGLPMALTFLRNWQQADAIKSQHAIEAKAKKEMKETLDEIKELPKEAVKVAPEILAGYTTAVGKAKAKSKR